MSAFLVSKRLIDLLVTAVGVGRGDRAASTQLGQRLWEENQKSLGARYHDNDPLPPYEFTPFEGSIDPVVVLKQIDCYEYQSCEHDGWISSKAREFCTELRDTMIGQLPGYDEAPWGIS